MAKKHKKSSKKKAKKSTKAKKHVKKTKTRKAVRKSSSSKAHKKAPKKHKKIAKKKVAKKKLKTVAKTPPPGGYATGETIHFSEDGFGKRAKAPAVVTAKGGTDFMFQSTGPDIVFDAVCPSDPPGLFPSGVPGPAPMIVTTLPKVDHKTPFKYFATCGGAPVEGNSPPIIIVDN